MFCIFSLERMVIVKKFLVVLLALLMIFSFAACESAGDQGGNAGNGLADDTVIATVNGDPVTYGLYRSYMDSSYLSYFTNYYSTMYSYYGIDLLDETSAADTVADMESYCWDVVLQSVLIRQLAENDYGVTLDEEKYAWLSNLLSAPYYDMMCSNLLYSDLADAVYNELQESKEVTEEDAKAAYEAAPESWNGRLSTHILVSCNVTDSAALSSAYTIAQGIVNSLNDGATVEEILNNNTELISDTFGILTADGALLDGSGSLVPEYVEALFALEAEGDYTVEPVLSDYGYHVIILDGIADSFEDVADEVTKSLSQVSEEEVTTKIDELIAEATANAEIEYKEDFYLYYEEAAEESGEEESAE